MKTILWICFLLFPLEKINIENPYGIMFPRGGDEDWGTGILQLPDCFSIKIYESESNRLFGYIIKEDSRISITNINGEIQKLDWKNNFECIGHCELSFLKTKFDNKTNQFKILWKSSKTPVYLDGIETTANNLKYFTYKNVLFGKTNKEINKFRNFAKKGVNIEKSCLNLRKKPNEASEVIECIPGNDWTTKIVNHLEIIEAKGNWAQVELTTWIMDSSLDNNNEEYGYREKSKKIGWLKAIDESGFPNIWYSISGY